METLQTTELGKSYWAETGVYQKQYSELYEKHVPASGMAKTLNGELIRAISRLFYEYCNNGNCNACHVEYATEEYTCHDCHGTGYYDEDEEDECTTCYGSGIYEEEYEEDGEVTEMYAAFLDLIEENVPDTSKEVQEVREFISENLYGSSQFGDKNMQKYNILCDKVIFYVLTNDDKDLPENYDN